MKITNEERARRALNMRAVQVERNRLIELGRYAESIGIRIPEGGIPDQEPAPTIQKLEKGILPPPPPPQSTRVVIPLPARGKLSAEIEAALGKVQRGDTGEGRTIRDGVIVEEKR